MGTRHAFIVKSRHRKGASKNMKGGGNESGCLPTMSKYTRRDTHDDD